jgi:hypothetical protein
MRTLWFRYLRSPWRVWIGMIAVAVSTVSTAAFDAVPELSNRYPCVAKLLWLLLILAIGLVLAERLPGSHAWKARIFRFDKKIFIVTGAEKDRQGNYSMPPYDRKAAELMAGFLRTIGIESQIDHCKSPLVPRNFGGNLILVCGPVLNEFSEEVNRQFQTEATWFNGFHFSRRINLTKDNDQDDPKEKRWVIHHRGITAIDVPFKGFPEQGVDEDCGIIYIGPNPINPDNWVIWVAGLGPIATYGAAKAFQSSNNMELLGRGLVNEHSYCSALIQYRFDERNPINGWVSSILVTGGSVQR